MSYDLEIYDSDGTVLFNSGTFALRATDVLVFQTGESGQYYVPDFDDTKGVIFFNGMYGATVAVGTDFDDGINTFNISQSWDNSSKIYTYDSTSASFSGTYYVCFLSFK